MSAWTCRHTDGKAVPKIVPPRLRIPRWKGLGADSEEKHEPVSDIDTVLVDSLKALDPKRPIREADIEGTESRSAQASGLCRGLRRSSGGRHHHLLATSDAPRTHPHDFASGVS